MTLRIAIGWSVLAHLGLLTIHPPRGTVPPLKALRSIEVTYQGEISRLSPQTLDFPHPSSLPSPPLGEKVRLRGQRDMGEGAKDRSVPKLDSPRQVPKVSLPLVELPSPSTSSFPSGATGQRAVVPLPLAEATGLPEEAYASVSHRREVRQHLKRHLRYPSLRIQGTVRLRLALDSNGFLKEATILESSDSFVAKTALEGVRAAQPYPRFPRELEGVPQGSYEFLIQYLWE